MKTNTTTKKSTGEIEELIEARIAEESETYELADWEIKEIRLEVYKENGWGYDPFDEDEEDGDEDATYYVTGFSFLRDIWMSERDFM